MIYIYKPKNKYPHVVHLNQLERTSNFYTEINPWCRENFGIYREGWFCPNSNHNDVEGVYIGDPYAFKKIEDAMAFKLLWG